MPNPENLTPWQKGQTGNPNGRPRKTLTIVNAELKEKGFARATSAQVLEAYELCLNLDEDSIQEIIDNKEYPFLLKAVAKQMLSKSSFDILEKILDRAHGKAKQAVEHTGKDGGAIRTENDVQHTVVFKKYDGSVPKEPIETEDTPETES